MVVLVLCSTTGFVSPAWPKATYDNNYAAIILSYTSESFPTHIRASIFGLINAVANAIAMIGPILIVALQGLGFVYSLIYIYLYISLFFFGAVILILLFGPKVVDR